MVSKAKKERMLRMLDTLEESIDRYEQTNREDGVVRDSVCTRFNYCVEGFWKYLKYQLEQVQGIALKETGPRAVIRAGVQYRLISEDEGRFLGAMIIERNNTSHMYHEEVACEVAKWAPELLKQLRIITLRL